MTATRVKTNESVANENVANENVIVMNANAIVMNANVSETNLSVNEMSVNEKRVMQPPRRLPMRKPRNRPMRPSQRLASRRAAQTPRLMRLARRPKHRASPTAVGLASRQGNGPAGRMSRAGSGEIPSDPGAREETPGSLSLVATTV